MVKIVKKTKKKSNKARNFIFIVIFIAAVAAIVIFASNRKSGAGVHKLETYMETEEVGRGEVRQVVSAQGPLQPYDTVHVRSEASGKVSELFVDVGDKVSVGDPLVELDQDDLRINLKRAEASVEAARASLAQQKKGWLPAERANMEDQVRRYELDLAQRESDLARTSELHTAGFKADAELESAEYARDQASLSLDNARAQLRILLDGSPEEIVAYYEAIYRQASADYESATSALGDSTILSPMTGVVLEKFITEGSVVVSSQASFGAGSDLIVLIGDLSKMKVQALVDETDIGRVKVGQKVVIEVDAFEGDEFEAEVIKINPMGSVTTTVTNFEVEMVIDNPDGKLLPNLTAYVDIITDEVTDVVIVPDSAIMRTAEKNYVFVVGDGDVLEQREVELGITDYENTEIKSGVEEGEKILVKGVPSEPFEEEKKDEATAVQGEESSTVVESGGDTGGV